MDYETIDYLPDLTGAEMGAALNLTFDFEGERSVGWDREATVFGSDKNALLHGIYKFEAIEGATYDLTSVSFFDPFLLRVYDKVGNTVVVNDESDDQNFQLSDGLYFADQINNWVAPYSGVYYVQASWNQGSYYTFYSLLLNEDINTVTRDAAVRIFASSGFASSVAGFAQIFGTTGAQHLSLGLGDFVLDASFNRGNDIIELPGAAAEYTVLQSGSVVLFEGLGSTYSIPIGAAGTPIVFDDGTRVLGVSGSAVKIGTQTIGATAAEITAAPASDPLEHDIVASAQSSLFMSAGAQVELGGNYQIFGSKAGKEIVSYVEGKIVLDASFNQGGDTVLFHEDADHFRASLVGSAVVLKSDEGSITIPFGASGMALDFFGDERTLRYDSSTTHVLIGSQIITNNEVTLG